MLLCPCHLKPNGTAFSTDTQKACLYSKRHIFQETSTIEGTAAEAQSEQAKRTEEPTEQSPVTKQPTTKEYKYVTTIWPPSAPPNKKPIQGTVSDESPRINKAYEMGGRLVCITLHSKIGNSTVLPITEAEIKGKLLHRHRDDNKRENTASRKLGNFYCCLKVPAWGQQMHT